MTEYSMPFPGTTIGDAGPYAVGGDADPGWWDCWGVMLRAGGRLPQTALADIGVFYCVDDQLECTEAADTISVDVDEGACLVDGTFHWNDTDPVNVPIPAAAAGLDRIDLVVVRKNYSAVTTYTPGGGAPTVGPREARITVIRGTEAGAPVAPSVTQDTTRATYWDVPLCSVQVDDGGTLSSLTDLREYVDAETKSLWVPPTGGWNDTDGADIERGSTGFAARALDSGGRWGYFLVVNKASRVWGDFYVPNDFLDDMTVMPVLRFETGTGAYDFIHTAIYGRCGQSALTHTDSIDDSESPSPNFLNICWSSNQLTLSTPTAGDIVTLQYQRDNTGDAYNADMSLVGWIVEYLGWR